MIKKEAVSFCPKMHHSSHELTMLATLTTDKDRNKIERHRLTFDKTHLESSKSKIVAYINTAMTFLYKYLNYHYHYNYYNSCESLTKMLKDLDVEKSIQCHLLSKIMNITICSTYFIFCQRNKGWSDPDLMDY